MIGKFLAVAMMATGIGMVASAVLPQSESVCFEDEPCWTKQQQSTEIYVDCRSTGSSHLYCSAVSKGIY